MHYCAIDPSPTNTAIVEWINHEDFTTGVEGVTLPIMAAGLHVADIVAKHNSFRALGWTFPLTVIIERPPQMPHGMTVESQQTIAAFWMLVWILKEAPPAGMKIISLGPGSWKPAAKAWKIEYPSSLTDRHQRDAYAMLQVHLATKKGSK